MGSTNRRGTVRRSIVGRMGTAKQAIMLAKERNDQPDDSGHAHPNEHADHRSENHHWHPYGELHHAEPGSRGFDLAQAAVVELHEAGFNPGFGRDVQEQVSEIERGIAHWRDAKSAADLRGLGWSSIDNDTSKDLGSD